MELVHDAVARAFWRYYTAPVNHDITLVSSKLDQKPIHLKWRNLTDRFSLYELPTRHMTMFTEPEVSILGGKLSTLIKEKDLCADIDLNC